jgi:hypothetical protein
MWISFIHFTLLMMHVTKILQSIDLIQSVYLKLHYDLKWDLWPCYLSKWNIIKKTTKFFPKTKLLVDELINDWVNDEIEWAFHGFDLRSWHGLFKSKQELVPLFGFITLKSWLLLEKFFKKVFFLSLKAFSKQRKTTTWYWPHYNWLFENFLKRFMFNWLHEKFESSHILWIK